MVLAFQLSPTNPQFNLHNETTSYQTLKTRGVVMQGFDLSCGSAALATLFQYYYGDKIKEKDILDFILKEREESLKKNIEKPEGLSLFDLKLAAENFNYRAEGFTISFDSIPLLQGPVIVHLKDETDGHFAVLKGVRGSRIYLADPARGNVRMTHYQFKKKWNGIIFVVEHNTKSPIIASPLILN